MTLAEATAPLHNSGTRLRWERETAAAINAAARAFASAGVTSEDLVRGARILSQIRSKDDKP